jgi:hypothetical protein
VPETTAPMRASHRTLQVPAGLPPIRATTM